MPSMTGRFSSSWRMMSSIVACSPASRTASDGEEVTQTLSVSSAEVSSLMALWRIQYASQPPGGSIPPPVRSVGLKNVLKLRASAESAPRRRHGGSDEDTVKHCWTARAGVSEDGKRKRVLPIQVESWLWTAVDILFSHSILLRREPVRWAELPDLFSVETKGEGATPCWFMLMVTDNGKTNHFGKLEYGVVARHRHPLCCTMSYLAFYLFFRWKIMREPPPTCAESIC
jgi:centromere DNA-binding complex CBF3 subunit-like protein